MMRWWLDRGVDGFRMDVINLISKVLAEDGSLPDGADPGAATPRGDRSPHYMNGPRIHEFLQEMHREVFDDRAGAGCSPSARCRRRPIEEARLYTDPARAEVDMVFPFEHVVLDHGPGGKWDLVPLTCSTSRPSLTQWQEGLAEVGWNSLYWATTTSRGSCQPVRRRRRAPRRESAKALATVLHLHRGTPYVYQGEELGMTNAHFDSVEDCTRHRVAQLRRGGRSAAA